MGILLELGVILVIVLVSYAITTQIILPVLNGIKCFPFFRKKKELEEKLAETKQQLDDVGLENKIKEVEKEIEEKKGGK